MSVYGSNTFRSSSSGARFIARRPLIEAARQFMLHPIARTRPTDIISCSASPVALNTTGCSGPDYSSQLTRIFKRLTMRDRRETGVIPALLNRRVYMAGQVRSLWFAEEKRSLRNNRPIHDVLIYLGRRLNFLI